MKLYLMQHGKALSKEENPERPLSDQGRNEVYRVAAFLAQAEITIDQIRHSGKRRAEETAQIVAEHLSSSSSVTSVSGINPNDDVQPIAESLRNETQTVMLVGHLPFLSRLASFLLAADYEQTLVRFRNGGVVCLEYQDQTWSVSWVIVPDLLQ